MSILHPEYSLLALQSKTAAEIRFNPPTFDAVDFLNIVRENEILLRIIDAW